MAIDLTGIQNIGEFYSHHYLDALLEGDLKGLYARWREADGPTPDRRLNGCAGEFFSAKSRALKASTPKARYPITHRLHVCLLEALGYVYQPADRFLLDGSAVPLLCAVERDGQDYLYIVETPFTDPDESPLEQGLVPNQGVTDEGEPSSPGTEYADQPWEELIRELFRADDPPRWIMLLAGRYIYLLDRTKWGRGQYLLFDLDELFGRREASALRVTAALLAADALCPDDGPPLHETLDENSHKHAYAVSSDLKYGVRKAVELLANEYVRYVRNVSKTALYQDDQLADKLTREALTYLYRLLFLFYAEARGAELELTPMKSEAYRTAYSLESLRDLEQVPLTTPQAENGYFFHESLTRLFQLVNEGFNPQGVMSLDAANGDQEESYDAYGFRMKGLHSSLFDPERTPLLSRVKFRNRIWQEIIQSLSLSKEGKGRNSKRGRISYAQLGINQLGAVYEGLLSYSGFFAQEPLYEVKPADADPAREDVQTYFITGDQLDRYEPDEFVYEEDPGGGRRRKQYERGRFIFRLAGRDREKSASYYTPEVLTRAVVKYSVRELLPGLGADDILKLTICEPAMGSGAFINEALNQLADAYLARKQAELGERLPSDRYREERQKVKATLAANNVYGMDLNPTAVELATVSIWLNTIYRGAAAPWYAARLGVGNSLIGARRAVYLAEDVLSGAYQQKAPQPVPLGRPRPQGSVYHWLLPDKGMAAFDRDKVIKTLVPEQVQAIKAWRKGFTKKISRAELGNMQILSDLADELWERHLAERRTVLARTRAAIPLWGQLPLAQSANPPISNLPISAKETELAHLHRPTSPYRRLKLAMDAWSALWFWPVEEGDDLPTRAQFLNDIEAIFRAEDAGFERGVEQISLFEALEEARPPRQAHFAEMAVTDVDALVAENPRLQRVRQVAARQRFHHWELAFPEVFAERGGFDLILGNPPWVLMSFDEKGVLSDFEPLLVLRSHSAAQVARERAQLLADPDIRETYLAEFVEQNGIKSYLGATQNYPLLAGKPNLYKNFIVRSWKIGSSNGSIGFLHPEGVYDDPKGGSLREGIYPRLKAHFQFHNELKLFKDIGNVNRFSINIYTAGSDCEIGFDNIVNLYHPTTIDRCYAHDGVGAIPGIRDEYDNWELRGHRRRIVTINLNRLRLFAELYDEIGTPPLQARLPTVHSEEIVSVLEKFSLQKHKLGDLEGHYYSTQLWNETNAQKDSTIRRVCQPARSLHEWIVSGPHFHISTPFFQTPNEGCRSHRAYTHLDLTAIPDDYLPRTVYAPACSPEEYLRRTPKWRGRPVTDFYRHANREMVGPTAERTLISAILPRQTGQINTVFSVIFETHEILADFETLASSLPVDFLVKSTGMGHANLNILSLIPIPKHPLVQIYGRSRILRLNCLTVHYADLWEELYDPAFNQDAWTLSDPRLSPWQGLTPGWQRAVALRTPFERRQALVEIDVLAACQEQDKMSSNHQVKMSPDHQLKCPLV